MTANVNWPEFLASLSPGQTPADCPDLVACVFQLKKQELLDLITKKGILGHTVAHVYTIEFQKRGLPHMHLLIWFKEEHKLKTPEDVDSLISAEFPEDTNSRLFGFVKDLMTHGPCGSQKPNAPCMDHEKKRCSKYFPKEFQDVTDEWGWLSQVSPLQYWQKVLVEGPYDGQ